VLSRAALRAALLWTFISWTKAGHAEMRTKKNRIDTIFCIFTSRCVPSLQAMSLFEKGKSRRMGIQRHDRGAFTGHFAWVMI
jgi:hypothetical protein